MNTYCCHFYNQDSFCDFFVEAENRETALSIAWRLLEDSLPGVVGTLNIEKRISARKNGDEWIIEALGD